jgi:release factor glutamine methyltransferase
MVSILSVAAALSASGLPGNESRILLRHVLSVDQAWLIAHDADTLNPEQAAAFAGLCKRRRDGEPVAYLVGSREFYGLSIRVTPAVLIPRPETELLVDLALARLAGDGSSVLDLGTGSGAVALAIALNRPTARIAATEVSVAALAVARANGDALGATVEWLESDWYAALEHRRFDLIVSNPPYIAQDDPHLVIGDLRFEPPLALTPAGDGLAAIRKIVAGAPAHLESGGRLLFEHGYDHAEQCRALLAAAGFSEVQSWRDLAGIERVSGGVAK